MFGRGSTAGVFALAILLATCLAPARGAAQSNDSWFGKDKALHLAGTTALSGLGYGIGLATTDHRGWGSLVGVSTGLFVGGIKELVDLGGGGSPSWKDFTWDVVGTVLGVGIALLIDLAARGLHPGGERSVRAEGR